MSKAKASRGRQPPEESPRRRRPPNADPAPVSVWVVERATGGGLVRPDDDLGDEGEPPCYLPVAAFPTREAAEAEADRLDAEVRADFPPPFAYGLVTEGGGPKKVAAALAELGLPPPEFTKQAWRHPETLTAWWATCGAAATPGQRAGVWEALGGPRTHRVVERQMEG